ncbi:UNVERIFIED_ORG: PAS domain S-box-containing protein [Burkholderia sp. 1263]
MKKISREPPQGLDAATRRDDGRVERTAAEPDALAYLKNRALNLVREAAYLIDRNARFIYANDEACRTLGYDHAQLLQMRVMDVDPEWSLERWQTAWAELREKGSLLVESTQRRQDGTTLPVEINASYFEFDGEPYNLALVRDITERKRTEALLIGQLQMEAQFRRLAESTPDIICRYDPQCRLVYANSGLASILRRPLQDLLGGTPTEHSADPQFAVYQRALAATLETGAERTLELALQDGASGSSSASYHHVRILAERGLRDEITSVLALGRDITERKKAEAHLHASGQAFRALVEHSPDYIARYDRECRRVYANPALRALLPQGTDETADAGTVDDSPVVDVPRYRDRLRRVVETGTERMDEIRFRNAKGEVRWGHMRMVPEFAADGRVATVLAICRDIDELKRSEQLFRTLTESFPDFIARFDREGRHTYVNPRVSKAFGMPQEDFIGKQLHELQTGGSSAQNELLEASVRRVVATGEPADHEALWATDEGWHVFEVRHIPEKDAEGDVVSVLGVARDVTRLRTTELALRASEVAFRTLAENAPEMIVRYDRDCRYSYVNPRFEQINGIRAADAVGKTPAELSAAAMPELQMITATLDQVMTSGIGAKVDLTWERDGKPVGWHVSAVPEHDADGETRGALTIWTDITARMEAELRLRESYALLQELTSLRETAREEERKRIAREMHDELGQQLTALRLGVSAMRIEFARDNSVLAERFQDLLSLADGTMQVVRNVVASLRPAALDAGIVAALEWLAAEFSRDGRVVCRLRIPDDNLVLDEERAVALFRIVQEALTNVARHAGASEVTISLEQVEQYWNLEIRDDGRGFDSTAPRAKSFGLVGMRERALMLGGEISVHSAPGSGTSIAVRIPADDEASGRRME